MSRPGWWATALLVAAGAAAAAGHLAARAVVRRAAAVLDRAGITAREVRFHWLGPLRLHDVVVPAPEGASLSADKVDVGWRLRGGGDPRAHVRRLTLHGVRVERAPVSVHWPHARFDVVAWTRDGAERLKLRQPGADGGQMDAVWPPRNDEPLLAISSLDLAGMEMRWKGETLVQPGRWTGRASLVRGDSRTESEGAFHGESARLLIPHAVHTERRRGEPTSITLEWGLCRDDRAIDIDRFAVRFDGFELVMRGALRRAGERHLDLQLSARSELAAAFRTVGLPPPLSEAHGERFGRAWLDLAVRGPLGDPEEMKAEPRLRFEVTPEVEQALFYLKGPFHHRPDASPGVVIDVRPGTPDFIPITSVPELFRRALLFSEDPGFSVHAGIDVSAIVAAWSRNQEEGRIVSGGSTITQQLVKNLMLSREKTYGRKLQEAALALMVDAVVPKTRLLEIYVNVIEWGPGLHGLVPAARHYFDKRPERLTVKEAVFLVSIIPAPVKFHEGHLAGRPTPAVEENMERLLARMYRGGVLSEESYYAALYEPLQFPGRCASRS